MRELTARFDFPSVFRSARRVIQGLGTESPKVIEFRLGLAREVLETHKDRDIYGTSGLELYTAVVEKLGEYAERILLTGDLQAVTDALRKLNKPHSTNIAIADDRWLLKAFQETFRDYPAVTPSDARELRMRALNLLHTHGHLIGKFPAEPFLAYIVACAIREKTLGMSDVGRTSVCWVCRLSVMEVFNPACPSCRWMCCVCGACSNYGDEASVKASAHCEQPGADWFLKLCDMAPEPREHDA